MLRPMEYPPDAGFPATSRPRLTVRHVDGPLLTFRDGQVHWLTFKERLLVWFGQETALSLEMRLRPDLYGRA